MAGEKYTKERYNPTLPHCVQPSPEADQAPVVLNLSFDGKNLSIKKGNLVAHSYAAVSGSLQDGKFDYSKKRQKEANAGPIPEGTYWIRPDEISKAGFWRDRVAWGNYRITIHPFEKTQTYGRGGFFIHGGAVPGSIGCIDLTTSMDQFVADLQALLQGTRQCQIHLVVKY